MNSYYLIQYPFNSIPGDMRFATYGEALHVAMANDPSFKFKIILVEN